MPCLVQLRNEIRLRVRSDFRAHLVDPELAGDRIGHAAGVARHHQRAETHAPQVGDRVARRGFGGVGKRQNAARLSVDRPDEDRPPSFLVVREDVLSEVGEPVHPGERGVPDPDVVAVHGRVNPSSGQRLERRRLGQGEAFRRGELDDRRRERMLRPRFGTREDADHLVFADPRAVHVLDDPGPTDGKGAGLVEGDDVDRSRHLQRLRAFDEDPP